MGDADNVIDWNNPDRAKRSRRKRPPQENISDDDPSRWLKDAGLASSYDPSKFYLKSSDSRGHQHTVNNVNVPQSFALPLAIIREHFPEYRTNADVVRDALVHLLVMRMHQRETGQLTALMENEIFLSQMQYNLIIMQQREAEIEGAKAAIDKALGVEDWKQLEIILQTMEDKLVERAEEDGGSPYYIALQEQLNRGQREVRRARDNGKWKG